MSSELHGYQNKPLVPTIKIENTSSDLDVIGEDMRVDFMIDKKPFKRCMAGNESDPF